MVTTTIAEMRILLVVPTHNYQYGYPSFLSVTDFPTGPAFLASALREAGHEVFGLNLNNIIGYPSAYEMICDRIGRSLQEAQPELIGLGGLCTDYQFIKDAMQIIRRLAPDVPIICGGGIINNDAEYVFKLLRPDFCIIGEGEEIIVQLANMLERGGQDYGQIENLGYWKNNTALFTKLNFDYIDINQRHFPDYEPFGIKEMLDNYSLAARNLYRYTRPYPRPMVIVTARSCPFNCTFCVHKRGPRYRARSVENIIQEISLMYEKYSFNVLVILDELFVANKSRMREFCTALLESRETLGWDFDWMFQTHANASLDREVLGLAKKAGCYFFSYGLESASPRVLASMNKKTKISQVIKAIEIADSADIGFGGNFIFGDPAETEETISETMDFFSQYCLDKHIFLAFLQPYPGSQIFETLMEKGVIRDKLEFYEHIDQRSWNMTLMPDRLWFGWVDFAGFWFNRFSWVKSSDAAHFVEETESIGSPMVSYYGKSIWKIWARCPHCGKEVFCREMVAKLENTGELKSKKSFSFFGRIGWLFSKVIKLLHNKNSRKTLALYVRGALYSLLGFRHPLFRTVKIILPDKSGVPSFITGCPHCNRRFRINLPPSLFVSESLSLKRKLLLRYISSHRRKA